MALVVEQLVAFKKERSVKILFLENSNYSLVKVFRFKTNFIKNKNYKNMKLSIRLNVCQNPIECFARKLKTESVKSFHISFGLKTYHQPTKVLCATLIASPSDFEKKSIALIVIGGSVGDDASEIFASGVDSLEASERGCI